VPADALQRPHWNGWGGQADNSRRQMTSADLDRLQLAWAFAFRDDEIAFAQPTVVAGRALVGSASGKLYALEARTGCTVGTQHWGPSGAGIWLTPTIDQKRRCCTAATGDSYSDLLARQRIVVC